MENIYSGVRYVEKRRRLGKCKGSSSRVWRKDKYRSKTIREARQGRRKEL